MKINSRLLQSSKKAGFTLVELLVTTAITSIILLSASTILMTFFLSNSRTTIRRQIKSEGNRALGRIEFIARGGQSCTNLAGNTGVTITSLGGDSVTTLTDTGTNITISVDGGTAQPLLTAFSLADTASVIRCETEGGKQYIRASLVITNSDTADGAVTETFTSFTVLRNS